MNYYERHLGDYAKDTGHLTMLEHGAYTLLLDRIYSTEAGIPEKDAHRLARARTAAEKAAVDSVLQEFFTLQDGAWINGRAFEEIEKAQVKISAARENGKKGGRPKKLDSAEKNETKQKPTGFSVGSNNKTQQEPNEKLPETQTKAHQTPVLVNPLPSSSLRSEEGPSPRSAKQKSSTFAIWLKEIRAKGEKPVSTYKAVWDYAERSGLPADWIELAWLRFRERYENDEKASSKRYTDWRRVFLRAVKENWLGLWCWAERDQAFRLTTQGMQAENALRGAA